VTRFAQRHVEDMADRAQEAAALAQAARQLVIEGHEGQALEALVALILPLQEALILARLALSEAVQEAR
jgi:hypothetical protein